MALTKVIKKRPQSEPDTLLQTRKPDSLKWLYDVNIKNGKDIIQKVDLNGEKPKATGNYAFETKERVGGFGGNNENTGTENTDLLNVGAQSLKYLVPAARLISNERKLKDLRSKSQLNLEKVQLMHGTVKDLQKPNFALRYRDPAGSSLAEMVGGQKFGDAQQREAERDWELQNSTSRIQQQQGINASKNQEASINNQITNAGKQFNANMANQERFARMANQEELELGLTETALNDVNQKNYLDATQEASTAADILRYGQPGSDEYKKAQEYYMNVVGRNKAESGRKEPNRKLKRKTKLSYAS